MKEVIEKLIKAANINDPDINEIMRVLNARIRSIDKIINNLKDKYVISGEIL